MKVLVAGGCKNGKSSYAEALTVALADRAGVTPYYIATMRPVDEEDRARIVCHQYERSGLGFETLECHVDISSIRWDRVLLIDSATALLANEMFPMTGDMNLNIASKVADDLCHVLSHAQDCVVVSDSIGSDAQVFDAYTDEFRRGLAFIERQCAQACDVVIELCAGQVVVHKGQEHLSRSLP